MTNTTIDQTKEILELKKQVQLLTQVADKAKLARRTPQEDFGQTVKINLYRADYNQDYKVVTGWKLLKDEVFYGEKHKVETQIVQLDLLDTKSNEYSKVEMTYEDFNKNIDKESVNVVSNRLNRKTGQELVTVEWNGKEYELGLPFIN